MNSRGAARRRRSSRQAASACCLGYPDDRRASPRLHLLRAALAEDAARQADELCAAARILAIARDPLDDPAAALRRCLRPVAASTPLPVVLDRRRHPPPRRGAGRVQAALPRQRLPGRHPRRAARLPADGAGVRGDRRPRRRDRAAAGVPAQPRAAPAGSGARPHAVRRRGRRGVRDAAGRLAAPTARP